MVRPFPACAGSSKQWKSPADTEDGIAVRYRIYETPDRSGKDTTFVEDESTSTAQASLEDCQRVMRDVAHHWTFTEDNSSSLIERPSPNSWLIYYYSKSPWPMKDTDRVMLMTQTNNEQQGSISFQFKAKPKRFEQRGVARMQLFDVTYVFTDLGNGKVKIYVKGRSIPPYDVPLWLIHSAFPGVQQNAMKGLISRLEESNRRLRSKKYQSRN